MRKTVNWRAVAYPETVCRKEATIQDAEFLKDAIIRHCDVDKVELIYDDICSFCGSNWNNSLDEKGCPICCVEAIEEWETQQKDRRPE